ncbi:MAG: outer membrane beta-barrel protein [Hydrogenophaga sp.]
MKLNKLSALMVLGGLAIGSAHAGMVSDADGNVGFDTAAECDAAVLSGQARFYAPQTTMPALKRSGERAVSVSTLGQVDALYSRGACDIGVGRANNRNGVSANLRGKFIPFSPSMPVNAYTDASGKVVRVSMAQCDNRFSENMPRPVPAPAVVVAAPAPARVVPAPAPAPAPVMAAPVMMPKAAPVAAPAFRMTPYLFGTVGIQRDLIGNAPIAPFGAQHDDHAHALALQGGVGYQLSPRFGAEIFAQGGRELTFENGVSTKTSALGIRGTVGHDISEAVRVFGKLGFARVTHSGGVPSQSETRPTLGLGISYDINSNLAVRGDFDHFVKKSGSNWKALNYIGVGVQYNFMP